MSRGSSGPDTQTLPEAITAVDNDQLRPHGACRHHLHRSWSATIRRASMPTPVTTCRHHLPVGSLQEPSQSASPAAQAVMLPSIVGGPQAG